jgi:ATP-dependent Lon protease
MQFKVNETEFSEYDLGIGTTESGRRHAVSMLLPRKLWCELHTQRALAEKEKDQAQTLEREHEAQARMLAAAEKKHDDDDDDGDTPDPKVEALKPFAQEHLPGVHFDDQKHSLAYAPQAPIDLLKRTIRATSSDLRDRDLWVYRELRRLGPLRKLCNPVLRSDFERTFQSLRENYPHFHEVIDYVYVTLMSMRHQVRRLQPILLLGPPGVGKSCFTHNLAKAIDAVCLVLQMDAAVTRMTLVGSDRRYSNSAAGELFNLICLGEQANPIVLLDELDKAMQDGRDGALTPLHGILEPVTAKRFCDISVQISFDISMVSWVATANDPHRIPPTLRSRFREFNIVPPQGAQAIAVSLSVINKVLNETAPAGFEPAARSIAVALAHLNPREIYQLTERAVAHALSNSRNALRISDYQADAQLFQIDGANKSRKAGGEEWLH